MSADQVHKVTTAPRPAPQARITQNTAPPPRPMQNDSKQFPQSARISPTPRPMQNISTQFPRTPFIPGPQSIPSRPIQNVSKRIKVHHQVQSIQQRSVQKFPQQFPRPQSGPIPILAKPVQILSKQVFSRPQSGPPRPIQNFPQRVPRPESVALKPRQKSSNQFPRPQSVPRPDCVPKSRKKNTRRCALPNPSSHIFLHTHPLPLKPLWTVNRRPHSQSQTLSLETLLPT